MQSRHELVFGFERNDVDTRMATGNFRFDQPTLLRGDDQCDFGRISLHAESAVLVDQLRVIAKKSGFQAFGQGGVFGAGD